MGRDIVRERCCTQPYPCICKEAVSGFEPMTNKSPRHNFTTAPGFVLKLSFFNILFILSQWTATKFKEEKLYCISMHPTILYDSECWILKKQHKIRVRVAEIKIIK